MEVWDLYDINRFPLGKTITRGKKQEPNTFHIVIHICIFNTQNQMLIQQRQPFKEGWANLWDITVGGSAHQGETSQEAAKRELFEELGFLNDFSNVRPRFTINFDSGFDDFYVIHHDIELNRLNLQYEEVKAVKWASKEEILHMINDNSFIPYHKSLIDMIFAMKESYGAHEHL